MSVLQDRQHETGEKRSTAYGNQPVRYRSRDSGDEPDTKRIDRTFPSDKFFFEAKKRELDRDGTVAPRMEKYWKKVNKIKYFRNTKRNRPAIPDMRQDKNTAKLSKNKDPPLLKQANSLFTIPIYIGIPSLLETPWCGSVQPGFIQHHAFVLNIATHLRHYDFFG